MMEQVEICNFQPLLSCAFLLSVSVPIKSNPSSQVLLRLPQCGVLLQAADLSYPPPPEGRKGF